jgi:hypothetical protein
VTTERETIVALVVLRPGSGRAITGESQITAENLEQFAPNPSDAEVVARALADAGFSAGPVVGVAMSVSGPRERFEDFFDVDVADAENGGWVVAGGGRELPLHALREDVREQVHAVTFEPPAEALVQP